MIIVELTHILDTKKQNDVRTSVVPIIEKFISSCSYILKKRVLVLHPTNLEQNDKNTWISTLHFKLKVCALMENTIVF